MFCCLWASQEMEALTASQAACCSAFCQGCLFPTLYCNRTVDTLTYNTHTHTHRHTIYKLYNLYTQLWSPLSTGLIKPADCDSAILKPIAEVWSDLFRIRFIEPNCLPALPMLTPGIWGAPGVECVCVSVWGHCSELFRVWAEGVDEQNNPSCSLSYPLSL